MAQKKRNISILSIVLTAVLILYSLVIIILLVWGFLSSFRDNLGFIRSPFTFEGGIHISNYQTVFEYFKTTVAMDDGSYRNIFIEEMFLYSIIYSLGCSFIQTLVTCIMAYVASRFNFKLSKFIYTLVIVVMSLPIVGNLPAEISMAKSLGVYGTMWGMFIMKASFLGAYFLVFAAVYKGVPKDFTEASYIDGAGEFTIFFKIMLPMVKDTFMTIMLLTFISFWNDYSIPMIYLPEMPPLALGLYRFNASTDNEISPIPIKLAGCFTVLLPILIIFIAFQKKLMGNLSMGGLKE